MRPGMLCLGFFVATAFAITTLVQLEPAASVLCPLWLKVALCCVVGLFTALPVVATLFNRTWLVAVRFLKGRLKSLGTLGVAGLLIIGATAVGFAAAGVFFVHRANLIPADSSNKKITSPIAPQTRPIALPVFQKDIKPPSISTSPSIASPARPSPKTGIRYYKKPHRSLNSGKKLSGKPSVGLQRAYFSLHWEKNGGIFER